MSSHVLAPLTPAPALTYTVVSSQRDNTQLRNEHPDPHTNHTVFRFSENEVLELLSGLRLHRAQLIEQVERIESEGGEIKWTAEALDDVTRLRHMLMAELQRLS